MAGHNSSARSQRNSFGRNFTILRSTASIPIECTLPKQHTRSAYQMGREPRNPGQQRADCCLRWVAPRRTDTRVPVLAAGKAVVKATAAGWYFYQMPSQENASCGYCIVGALTNVGIVLLIIREARRALTQFRSRTCKGPALQS